MGALATLTAVVTSVDIGTPTALNTTPLLGGRGKKGILRIPVLPLTSTVKIQGATKDEYGRQPAEGDSLWTDIATITSASAQIHEITLPDFIRWNTTVLDADGPNVLFYVEAAP